MGRRPWTLSLCSTYGDNARAGAASLPPFSACRRPAVCLCVLHFLLCPDGLFHFARPVACRLRDDRRSRRAHVAGNDQSCRRAYSKRRYAYVCSARGFWRHRMFARAVVDRSCLRSGAGEWAGNGACSGGGTYGGAGRTEVRACRRGNLSRPDDCLSSAAAGKTGGKRPVTPIRIYTKRRRPPYACWRTAAFFCKVF